MIDKWLATKKCCTVLRCAALPCSTSRTQGELELTHHKLLWYARGASVHELPYDLIWWDAPAQRLFRMETGLNSQAEPVTSVSLLQKDRTTHCHTEGTHYSRL